MENINKVKELDRYVSQELRAHQMKNVSMLAFLCLCGIKESLFYTVSLFVMNNVSSMIIVSVEQASQIRMKHLNIA